MIEDIVPVFQKSLKKNARYDGLDGYFWPLVGAEHLMVWKCNHQGNISQPLLLCHLASFLSPVRGRSVLFLSIRRPCPLSGIKHLITFFPHFFSRWSSLDIWFVELYIWKFVYLPICEKTSSVFVWSLFSHISFHRDCHHLVRNPKVPKWCKC